MCIEIKVSNVCSIYYSFIDEKVKSNSKTKIMEDKQCLSTKLNTQLNWQKDTKNTQRVLVAFYCGKCVIDFLFIRLFFQRYITISYYIRFYRWPHSYFTFPCITSYALLPKFWANQEKICHRNYCCLLKGKISFDWNKCLSCTSN